MSSRERLWTCRAHRKTVTEVLHGHREILDDHEVQIKGNLGPEAIQREPHKLGSALVCTNTRGTGTTCRAILFNSTWKQSTFLPPCPRTSMEHHTLRRQHCVAQYRRRKKRLSQAHTSILLSSMCVCVWGGSLSRLQEGNHGLAQANCSWLKNLQVAKNRAPNAHTLTLNSILNYPESPQSLFSCLRLFSLFLEYHSSTYFLIQQIFARHWPCVWELAWY